MKLINLDQREDITVASIAKVRDAVAQTEEALRRLVESEGGAEELEDLDEIEENDGNEEIDEIDETGESDEVDEPAGEDEAE